MQAKVMQINLQSFVTTEFFRKIESTLKLHFQPNEIFCSIHLTIILYRSSLLALSSILSWRRNFSVVIVVMCKFVNSNRNWKTMRIDIEVCFCIDFNLCVCNHIFSLKIYLEFKDSFVVSSAVLPTHQLMSGARRGEA